MKFILFLALIAAMGCEKNQKRADLSQSSQSHSEAPKADQVLEDEDCDDKVAKSENKAEETMMNLQGGGDAGCTIE